MKHTCGWCLAAFLGAACAAGAGGEGKLIEEIWEIAEIDGARAGWVHTTVRSRPDGKSTRLRATAEMELTFRRRGALVRLRVEHGSEEAPDGKVLGVFMRQHHPGGRKLVLVGALDGEKMHVKVDGGRIERRLNWSRDAVGLYGLEHLFAKRKPKHGERLRFRRYEPTLNTLVTVQATVARERESVALPGGRKSLLRVELTPERIKVPGHSVQPPKWVWWLDADFVPVRRQFELEGLGTVTLTRSTRARATAPLTAPGRLVDIGLKSLIPLNRAIPRPHDTRSVLYRVTLRGEDDPATALARDAHQEVRNVKGNTFELLVHPVRPAEGESALGKPAAEYLGSSRYIDTGDARIKELARRAAGGEKDAWKKARRIERWVKGAMRVDNAAPLVRAGQVARSLRGDCRHYALLCAALCRAAGVPARTAVGLVYVERGRRPFLGFHMWTEVWADGRWLGLDATLGRGGVGATHVKIADHSWYKTASLTPLLPVGRVLGKMKVEVVRVKAD
jgi:transglutaminase-like putative cysteine protease